MTDNRTTELLPCPFCGGEAFINGDPTGNGGKPHMHGNVGLGRLWSVECDECGADGGFWQEREIAIAAWNTRAELGDGTCELTETDSYSNANEVIHVLECSACGETCEHVNGSYLRCPHCGRKVVSA